MRLLPREIDERALAPRIRRISRPRLLCCTARLDLTPLAPPLACDKPGVMCLGACRVGHYESRAGQRQHESGRAPPGSGVLSRRDVLPGPNRGQTQPVLRRGLVRLRCVFHWRDERRRRRSGRGLGGVGPEHRQLGNHVGHLPVGGSLNARLEVRARGGSGGERGGSRLQSNASGTLGLR